MVTKRLTPPPGWGYHLADVLILIVGAALLARWGIGVIRHEVLVNRGNGDRIIERLERIEERLPTTQPAEPRP